MRSAELVPPALSGSWGNSSPAEQAADQDDGYALGDVSDLTQAFDPCVNSAVEAILKRFKYTGDDLPDADCGDDKRDDQYDGYSAGHNEDSSRQALLCALAVSAAAGDSANGCEVQDCVDDSAAGRGAALPEALLVGVLLVSDCRFYQLPDDEGRQSDCTDNQHSRAHRLQRDLLQCSGVRSFLAARIAAPGNLHGDEGDHHVHEAVGQKANGHECSVNPALLNSLTCLFDGLAIGIACLIGCVFCSCSCAFGRVGNVVRGDQSNSEIRGCHGHLRLLAAEQHLVVKQSRSAV